MARRIFLAGHRGMVGAALRRRLRGRADIDLLTAERSTLDLRRQDQVEAFLAAHRPQEVWIAAARVGGIAANEAAPADFLHDNLAIATTLIQAAHRSGVETLLFLGSSCIYPRLADQPIGEEALLTGPLEPTNAPYAIAKIAGIALCEALNRQHGRDYRCLMPTNLYGPGDNFDVEAGHVIPALIRRFHAAVEQGAPEVTIWGSGAARREFLHVDDLADACLHVMAMPAAAYHAQAWQGLLNVGSGEECSIRDLAGTLADIAGYRGRLRFDADRPEGTPRKLLDCSRLRALGWSPYIDLPVGLRWTYEWFATEAACWAAA
ncbi:GDP-L-fucose synthase family protein [Oceanibaculum pacificum]|uniref:GDP-L-fucose synthase n=1 Tax=Oceanibaculum pacificum TaxID=580166 RepID=A0A154W4U4_9PROT|nr:GDP-L-fucose synthase [Oceanibaculum pacificum]KZD08568.1 GDP-fucose synthetase [Oceanibaculum pacificum]